MPLPGRTIDRAGSLGPCRRRRTRYVIKARPFKEKYQRGSTASLGSEGLGLGALAQTSAELVADHRSPGVSEQRCDALHSNNRGRSCSSTKSLSDVLCPAHRPLVGGMDRPHPKWP